MRSWRIVAVLLLGLVLAGATACNPFGGDKEEVSQQLVKVVRGDLIISVSGSGNIEVSKEAKLTFGSGGKVDKIHVKEGDKVTKGRALAELDTDALELALTQAKVARAQAQVALTQEQVAQSKAHLAVTQAQIALQTAEYNLEKARDLYTLSDIRVAQADVDEAERYLDEALWTLGKYSPGSPGWVDYQRIVIHAQSRLNAAEDRLDAMLSGCDTKEVDIKKLQVEAAQQSLELAQQSMASAQQSLELAQQSLELAQQSLELAQKQLDETIITAPFKGIIASVSVKEGDIIPSPTMSPKIIIHLIDPSSMELKVEVDEIDMPGVKLGQRAIIEVGALPNLPLEGEVIFISLLAREEAGVVLYEVKISFDVPEGSGLRAGMSVEADIVINERNNVLLVPSRAIKQDSQGNSMVEVMVGKEAQERPIVIGISDGFDTEIVEGLNEGEVVVIGR